MTRDHFFWLCRFWAGVVSGIAFFVFIAAAVLGTLHWAIT